jgi:type 1 glutamine amidotransferase
MTIILEGENQNGRMPVAWTRVRDGRRLFYLALGYAYDLEKVSFRRIVANAVRWVSTPEPAK